MPPWTLQIGTEGPGWCSLALPCPCPQLPSRRVRCAALLSRKLHPLLRQSRCCLSLLGFIPKRVLMQRLHLYPTFSPSFVFLYSSGIVGGPALWGGCSVDRGRTLGRAGGPAVWGGGCGQGGDPGHSGRACSVGRGLCGQGGDPGYYCEGLCWGRAACCPPLLFLLFWTFRKLLF